MQLTLFGINLLLLILVWRFMIRKTILDNSRDKLFDLRDELRATFVRNEWDLNSPLYKKMRDLLNGHLRFTEEFSIWKILYLDVSMKEKKHLQTELHDRVQNVFISNDPKQQEFIKDIRRRAVVSVMNFAVFGSGLLLLLSLLFAPIVLTAKIIEVVGRGVSAVKQVFGQSLLDFGSAFSMVMSSSAEIISKHLFAEDVFENYSYRIGSA